MQFSVNKTDLARELALLQCAVARKTTLPILNQLRLEAKSGSLEIRATDLELAMIASCPAKVTVEGVICAPAVKLLSIIKSLPDGDVGFHLKDCRLTLKSGRATFSLMTTSDQNFPMPPESPVVSATIPGPMLRSLIERTRFAISKEESRYTLNSSLLVVKGSIYMAIATDGHRLSVVACGPAGPIVSEPAALVVETLLPANCQSPLLGLIDAAPLGSMVEFGQDDNHLFFAVAARHLVARKITGKFPNWEAVLPKDNSVSFAVDVKALTAALDRVLLLSDASTHAVKLELEAGSLTVSTESSAHGQATETLGVENDAAFGFIGFNGTYLLDFLRAAATEKVRVSLKDGLSSGEFSPVFVQDPEEKTSMSHRYVVMPMHI